MKNYQCPVILKNGNQCKKKRVRDKKGRLLCRCKTHHGKRGMPVVNGIFDKIAEGLGLPKDLGPTIKKFTPPGSIKNPIKKGKYYEILDKFFNFFKKNKLEISEWGLNLGSKELSYLINKINPGFLKKIIQNEIKNLPTLVQDTKSIISKKIPENPVIKFKNLEDLKGIMKEMKPENGINLLAEIDIGTILRFRTSQKDPRTEYYQNIERQKIKGKHRELIYKLKEEYLTSNPNYAPYRLSRQDFEENKNKTAYDFGREWKKKREKEQKESRILKGKFYDFSDSDSESEYERPQRTAQATPRRRAPSTPRSDIMSDLSSDEE